MTQNELIEMIDSTIYNNGVKGITAEVLASALKAIVSNSGTGGSSSSGDGALRIYGISGQDFNPDVLAEIESPEAGLPEDMVNVIKELYQTCINSNIEAYNKIVKSSKEGILPLVMFDSAWSNIITNLMYQIMYPEYSVEIEMCSSEPLCVARTLMSQDGYAVVDAVYLIAASDFTGEEGNSMDYPTGERGFELKLDGSLIFHSGSTSAVTILCPKEGTSAVLTEKEMESNRVIANGGLPSYVLPKIDWKGDDGNYIGEIAIAETQSQRQEDGSNNLHKSYYVIIELDGVVYLKRVVVSQSTGNTFLETVTAFNN